MEMIGLFLGEDADTVITGSGNDLVDFSEINAKEMVIVFNSADASNGFDIVYGFQQDQGDLIDISDFVSKTSRYCQLFLQMTYL